MNDKQWQHLGDFVATEVDGSHIVFGIESGNYISLNESANTIWQALAEPMSEGALTDLLVSRYQVDGATAGPAVMRTISDLAELKLIHTVSN